MATSRFNIHIYGRLHVFAAAPRHLSFTRAAVDLNVTLGIVSQQMRQLEELLAQVVAQSYGEVEEVLAHLQAGRIGGILRLRSSPSFLEKWIMPRLPALRDAFSHISFRFVAEDSSWSLRNGEFDLAVDLNDGIYPGLMTTPLARERTFPVCAPALLRGGAPLARAARFDGLSTVAQYHGLARQLGLCRMGVLPRAGPRWRGWSH